MNQSIVEYMAGESVKNNIRETLGKKTPQFIASVASLVNSNEMLATADRKSVLLACLTAASLDLPINQNLGFAFIIPYKRKDGTLVAQFQMGAKGFVQLAMRSGQFKTINVSDVKEGEIEDYDRLTGEYTFSWLDDTDRAKAQVIGYVAYMELVNGFRKTLFMSKQELTKHGMRFSQTMKKGYGLWKDDFDSMAKKTVIKLLLSKYAPLTVDMQKATLADQSIVEESGYDYVDNQLPDPKEVAHEKEVARIKKHIKNSKTPEELEQCFEAITEDDSELIEMYQKKLSSLSK